jgi:hypothetical protein
MNESIEKLAAATAAAKALARVKCNDSTRFQQLSEGIRDEINMTSNDTARTHQQFLQVMHKGRHVIAAAIIGVRIGSKTQRMVLVPTQSTRAVRHLMWAQ